MDMLENNTDEDNRVIPIKALPKRPASEKKKASLVKVRKAKREKRINKVITEKIIAQHSEGIKEFVSELANPYDDLDAIFERYDKGLRTPASEQTITDTHKDDVVSHTQNDKSREVAFVADAPTLRHIASEQIRTENTSGNINLFNQVRGNSQGILFM